MEEIWKIIEDYPQFEVSTCGNIRRIATDKVLKLHINKQGYLVVCVSLGQRGKQKLFKIHREVAKAFIPNPENKPQVNHIDGDKLNPHVTNLEWATCSENIVHARTNGLANNMIGENNHFAKLSYDDVEWIRCHYVPYGKNGGLSAVKLAELFHVSVNHIYKIVSNSLWK